MASQWTHLQYRNEEQLVCKYCWGSSLEQVSAVQHVIPPGPVKGQKGAPVLVQSEISPPGNYERQLQTTPVYEVVSQ